jgi:hypothetical protein
MIKKDPSLRISLMYVLFTILLPNVPCQRKPFLMGRTNSGVTVARDGLEYGQNELIINLERKKDSFEVAFREA